ncbi:hypothetical protein ABIC83_002619 [Roseateles asaccharophilus]|uniref:hypothetical protein n=1 Tax=Roseateles asaccharophilus TaxID=582607 RepID=UPI00383400C9
MGGAVIGPGEGAMIGLAWADQTNQNDFIKEREKLRRELANASREALGAKAINDAAIAVANEIVTEIAAKQQGKQSKLRLSDPSNVSGRNQAFMQTAENQLRRLSQGEEGFSTISQGMVNRSTKELGAILASPSSKPTLAPKAIKGRK